MSLWELLFAFLNLVFTRLGERISSFYGEFLQVSSFFSMSVSPWTLCVFTVRVLLSPFPGDLRAPDQMRVV